MSDKPILSLAAGYHLRAKALCDGRVQLKNFDLRAIAYENDGLGHDEFMAGKFDAGEFSLAMYLALKSRGAPYMAIPVFPNRKFRQSYIFVPEGSPLTDAKAAQGQKGRHSQLAQHRGLMGAGDFERRVRRQAGGYSLGHAAQKQSRCQRCRRGRGSMSSPATNP